MVSVNTKDVVGGTIVAQNYLAQAAVLSNSFYQQHPDGDFTTLVLDSGRQINAPKELCGRIITIDDLPVEREVLYQMVGSYSVMELATALKPTFLKYLLQQHHRAVVYLDPDIFVYAPLTEIFEKLQDSPIVLTPHAITPLPRDGMETSEETIRHAGIFNLGFIGINPTAVDFLNWWHERLIFDAVVDLSKALFTDQRWIDFVPSLFPFSTLTDPGLNVAYWNIHERNLEFDSSKRVAVNESTLKFMHFSGYDPEYPARLTKHTNNKERATISSSKILRMLADEYGQRLLAAGHATRKRQPYGFDRTPNGIPMNALSRGAYRRAIAMGGSVSAPNPFLEPDEFESWLCEPSLGLFGYRHARIEREIWNSRADLQHHFPDVDCTHSANFLKWLREDPDVQRIRQQFGTASRKQPVVKPLKRGGWNVVGYFSAELGVGEAGRRLARLVAQAGRPVEYVGATADFSRRQHNFPYPIAQIPRYENSILAVNADQTKRIITLSAIAQHPRKKRIGYWFWELEDFPTKWKSSFDELDEVWCSSDFVRAALNKVAPRKRIRNIRLPIESPTESTPYSRPQVGLPDGYVFLFTFDFNSVMKRKNPFSVVQAYCDAFGPTDGARLVLKSINGHHHRQAFGELLYAIQSRFDISLLDGYVSAAEIQAQIELSDSFVSLHRAEGYGLNLAAAMAANKPVIATGYSGNLEFMPADYPFLVDYTLAKVGDDAAPYDPNSLWAEPNLKTASEIMRRVFDSREWAEEAATSHRLLLLDNFSIDRCVAEMRKVLEEVE